MSKVKATAVVATQGVAPATRMVIGNIIKIAKLPNGKSSKLFLTTGINKVIELNIGNQIFDFELNDVRFEELLNEGDNVILSVEEQIEGKTHFLKDGKYTIHSHTGDWVKGVLPMTQVNMQHAKISMIADECGLVGMDRANFLLTNIK